MKPKNSKKNCRKWVLATVTDILPNEVHFDVRNNEPKVDKEYKIVFILNRLSFQMESRALETMKRFNLINFLFPEPVQEFNDFENRNHIQE